MTRGRLLARDGATRIDPCMRTTNRFERMRGLLFRPPPAAGAGLLIDPCASVHTWCMAYPIDVIYLDKTLRVLRAVASLRPWRMSYCRHAAMVLEMADGQASAIGIEPEMQFEWVG